MTFPQVSDLASIIGMRSRQSQIKSNLNIASQELVTGEKANLVQAAGGDLSQLFQIESVLESLSTDIDVLRVAAGKTSLMQLSLGRVGESLVGYGPSLLSMVSSGDIQSMKVVGGAAREKLEITISALNVKYGHHSLFSGSAVDRPALAPAEDLVADISAIVAGSANAAAAITSIDSYFFDPAGGFETNIYRGDTLDSGTVFLSDGSRTEYSIRADSLEIRQSLRAFVMAVVASDPGTFTGSTDQVALLKTAAESAINAGSGLLRTREKLGFAEESIEDAGAHSLVLKTAFEIERNGIRSVDPFEAATRLQELQVQLQTIYTLTARMSGLSLTNYLR